MYLVPTPLVEGQAETMPPVACQVLSACRHFVIESHRAGRRHLRLLAPDLDLDTCQIDLLTKDTADYDLERLLLPALRGDDLCVLSDAGTPAVADPGARLVALAHRMALPVQALPGPSSILLALMSSGLSGQSFTFHGYLSRQPALLTRQIRQLDQDSKQGRSQIFMETPYRNRALFERLLVTLPPTTLLSLSCELTGAGGFSITRSVAAWRNTAQPDIQNKPCIFIIGQEL